MLDEPTAAMDVQTRREFWRAMHEYTLSGRTVLFATHYLEEAETTPAGWFFPSGGRIVADGSVAEVTALTSGRTIRAAGWQRQLRLTPLSGEGYLATKGFTAMLVAIPAVILVPLVGGLFEGVSLSPEQWLHLSQGTVRNHLSSAIGKTGARTRAEAAKLAEQNGWL